MPDLARRRLGAALLFLAGVGIFPASNLEVIRFSSVLNSVVCSTLQIVNLPPQIDVAMIGSSRVRRSISASVLAEQSQGVFRTVYNFGRPYRQILRSEALVAHLLQSGRAPQIILLEADIDTIRLGKPKPWSWSPGEAAFLTSGEVFAAVPPTISTPRNILLRAFEEKLRVTLAHLLNGDVVRILLGLGGKPETVCWRPDFDVESAGKSETRKTVEAARRAQFGDVDTVLDDRFNAEIGPAGQMELAVIERIRHRVRAAGGHLVVVRPNGYADPPLSPAVISRLTSLIPELRLPPQDMARQLSHMHMDGSHYSPAGRELYSRWLAGILLAEVAPR